LREAKQRLSSLAENPNATIFLELDGVDTERQPGVAWQVYFGLPVKATPSEESPYYDSQV
jgi:hypothetical protein